MPVRDGGSYFSSSVGSVLDQTFSDWELLVIDDGLSEANRNFVRELRDERVKVLPNRGTGVIMARSTGVSASSAEVVAFLDADDEARADRLETQLGVLLKSEDLCLVASCTELIDDAGNEVGCACTPVDWRLIAHYLPSLNVIATSTVIARKAAVDQAGGFRTAAVGAEDYDLWLRMSALGRITSVPENLVRYRRHSSQVTAAKDYDGWRIERSIQAMAGVPVVQTERLDAWARARAVARQSRSCPGLISTAVRSEVHGQVHAVYDRDPLRASRCLAGLAALAMHRPGPVMKELRRLSASALR